MNPISLKGQMEEEKSSWNIFIKRTCVLRNVVVTANGFRGKLSKRLDRLIEIQDLYQSVAIGYNWEKACYVIDQQEANEYICNLTSRILFYFSFLFSFVFIYFGGLCCYIILLFEKLIIIKRYIHMYK